MIYLDHAATTPMRREALEATTEAMSRLWGNPSSAHRLGHEARAAVERSREQVARLIGCKPEQILFTSGGSEANNLALRGTMRALAARGRHLIVSAIEHSSVLATGQDLTETGCELTVLGVDADGRVDLAELAAAIRPDTVLASVMHVNNEIGSLQPVEAIGQACHARGVRYHSDSVQSAGKLPLRFSERAIDLLSVASHKIYGPKGVGALAVAEDLPLHAVLTGGSHERGLRAGTENVPGIVGFGVAAELAFCEQERELARQSALASRLREGLLSRIPGISLNGHPTERLPGNVNLSFPDIASDVLVAALDREGIAASGASACRSLSGVPSHVLEAIGALHPSGGSLRLTVGHLNDAEQIERVLDVLPRVVAELRSGQVASRF